MVQIRGSKGIIKLEIHEGAAIPHHKRLYTWVFNIIAMCALVSYRKSAQYPEFIKDHIYLMECVNKFC